MLQHGVVRYAAWQTVPKVEMSIRITIITLRADTSKYLYGYGINTYDI